MLSVALTYRRPQFDVVAACDVAAGEVLGLFGPSGAGKSTLLAVIAGLLRPHAGSVYLGARVLTAVSTGRAVHVPPWQRRIGLLRQDVAGFPHLTVAQNLAYSLPRRRLDAPTHALAATLGLEQLLERRLGQLSGGEQRRVALGQTLASRPEAVLLDEPFAALDAPVRFALGAMVRNYLHTAALPAMVVSHDLIELQRLCDRIAVLIDGQIRQIAEPARLVRQPADADVARLVGYTSFLPGDLTGQPGLVVAIHPDRLRLGAFPALGPVLSAVSRVAVADGAGWQLTLEVAGRHLIQCRVLDLPVVPASGSLLTVTLVAPPSFPHQRGELFQAASLPDAPDGGGSPRSSTRPSG